MTKINHLILTAQIWKDTRGQDMIEYALTAALVATMAGAMVPGIATSISGVFSLVTSVMTNAQSTGN
jgi:pilus assembly protein Flp/PilA